MNSQIPFCLFQTRSHGVGWTNTQSWYKGTFSTVQRENINFYMQKNPWQISDALPLLYPQPPVHDVHYTFLIVPVPVPSEPHMVWWDKDNREVAAKAAVKESIKLSPPDIATHTGASKTQTCCKVDHTEVWCQKWNNFFCKPFVWQLRRAFIESRFSFDQNQYNPGGPQKASSQNILPRYTFVLRYSPKTRISFLHIEAKKGISQ